MSLLSNDEGGDAWLTCRSTSKRNTFSILSLSKKNLYTYTSVECYFSTRKTNKYSQMFKCYSECWNYWIFVCLMISNVYADKNGKSGNNAFAEPKRLETSFVDVLLCMETEMWKSLLHEQSIAIHNGEGIAIIIIDIIIIIIIIYVRVLLCSIYRNSFISSFVCMQFVGDDVRIRSSTAPTTQNACRHVGSKRVSCWLYVYKCVLMFLLLLSLLLCIVIHRVDTNAKQNCKGETKVDRFHMPASLYGCIFDNKKQKEKKKQLKP